MHVFDVLSDPVRRRILELLGAGEMASGEVVEAIGAEFGITQAAVSQHLKVLRESGFARVRAEAQRDTIRWILRGFRRWMRGSVSSGVSGSRSWTRWRRRSREANGSGVAHQWPDGREEGLAPIAHGKKNGEGGIMSTRKTTKEVMRELAALEDPKMREANERRGDDHGVNLTDLRALAKRLKTQHDLALQLWATGDTAGRLLATLVCRPRPSRRQSSMR